MSSVDLSDSANPNLKGQIQVSKIRFDQTPLHSPETIILKGENIVVNSAATIISKLLQRDFSSYIPRFITLGSGGDLEQLSKIDSGARVAPTKADTEVREVVARLPIISVIADETLDNTWTYVAIARPTEALSASINEFAVESENGTLVSHYITSTASNEVRAEKFSKSSLEYLIVRWTFTLSLN